LGVNT